MRVLEYMNRAVSLSLLVLLLSLLPFVAGCTDSGNEAWYTPAPTPVMTIPYTPVPSCPTITAAAQGENYGNDTPPLPPVLAAVP